MQGFRSAYIMFCPFRAIPSIWNQRSLHISNKQQEIMAPWLCLLALAFFGPNTCCNYKITFYISLPPIFSDLLTALHVVVAVGLWLMTSLGHSAAINVNFFSHFRIRKTSNISVSGHLLPRLYSKSKNLQICLFF